MGMTTKYVLIYKGISHMKHKKVLLNIKVNASPVAFLSIQLNAFLLADM